MNIREALIQQSPSLALQRAAQDEIARLDGRLLEMRAAYDSAVGFIAESNPDCDAQWLVERGVKVLP